MPNISIDLEDLPRHLRGFADQVPFAASRALSSTAFDVKREAPEFMGDYLTLRNKYTAGASIRVDKASKKDLEARVGSTAWYVELQSEGAERKPRVGFVYKGKRYLVIPAEGRRNKRGKLKSAPSGVVSKPFAIRGRNSKKLLLAARKGNGKLFIYGALVPEATYDDRLKWRERVDLIVERQFPIRFGEAMDKAALTAR